MKHLFNYASIPEYENELLQRGLSLQQFVSSIGAEGMERFVYTTDAPAKRYADLTYGVHLLYWPTFMDFWLKNNKRLRAMFSSVNDRSAYYHEALGQAEWLGVIRKNIAAALLDNPEYLVWHVSEANFEEIYTWQFNYSDREVCLAASEIFNMVADEVPPTTKVLFENLWWPGLRLTDSRTVKFFFEQIKHPNVGIMLDTGHLMNTNLKLKTEQEGVDYILRVIDKLGPWAELIKGLHLNCSLCGDYVRSTGCRLVSNPTPAQVFEHIHRIDESRPFTTKNIKKIVDALNVEYINHEFIYDNLQDLADKFVGQRELLE